MSENVAYDFLPRRGLGVVLRRMFEAKNGYKASGNFRYVRVGKDKPTGDAALLLLTGFYFPPSLARPFLRRRICEWESDYKEGVCPSPIIKVGKDLLPPESLDGHIGVLSHFFEHYFSEHEGPIDMNGHSYAFPVLRHQLVELQHDPRIRKVSIFAPYLHKPVHVESAEDLLEAGRKGHRQELNWAFKDGRIEEYLLGIAGFNEYEKNAKRFESEFRACLDEMMTFDYDDTLPEITEIPVEIFLPKIDFLAYTLDDEEFLRSVFTHPKSDVHWVEGGHNKIFLRLAEGMRDMNGQYKKDVSNPINNLTFELDRLQDILYDCL